MGYGTPERVLAEGALLTWLTDSAGLPEGRARGVANSLANRPQLAIKRKALMHVLDTFVGHERSVEFFNMLIESHVLELQKGDGGRPGSNDTFAIRPPAASGNHKTATSKPAPQAFRPCSAFLRTRKRELAQVPLQTERNLEKLRSLDRWLAQAEITPPVPATDKQRAYEIFNDEKALSEHLDGSFGRLLKRIGVDNETLHIIDLDRQRLEAFIPHGSTAPILVVENGDTYESLKYVLGEAGRDRVLGQQLGGIVYGAGGAVCTPGLLDETLSGVNYRKDHVLYWGDIDRSGVAEVSRAREVCNVSIRLAKPFYRKMAQLQKERLHRGFDIEMAPRQSSPEHLDEISREVPLFARWMFLQTIREGKRIPQEIIPLEVLLE